MGSLQRVVKLNYCLNFPLAVHNIRGRSVLEKHNGNYCAGRGLLIGSRSGGNIALSSERGAEGGCEEVRQ